MRLKSLHMEFGVVVHSPPLSSLSPLVCGDGGRVFGSRFSPSLGSFPKIHNAPADFTRLSSSFAQQPHLFAQRSLRRRSLFAHRSAAKFCLLTPTADFKLESCAN